MRRNYLGLLCVPAQLGLLTLAGCGASGGGPQPIPPPPPAPTYNNFNPLGSTTFDASAARVKVEYRTGQPGTIVEKVVVPFSTTGSPNGMLSYDAASKTYTFRGSNFGPAELGGQGCVTGSAFDCYIRNVSTFPEMLLILKSGAALNGQPNFTLTYSTFFFGSHSEMSPGPDQVATSTRSYGVTGFKTVPSDLPKTGTASYLHPQTYVEWVSIDPRQSSSSTSHSGKANLTVDFGTGKVTTDLTLIVAGPSSELQFGPYTGNGSIAKGTSVFSGNIGDNSYTGSFEGAFFGPQAAEMGYSFLLGKINGTEQIIGAVLGKR